jgi:large subunit ribosomal protein L21
MYAIIRAGGKQAKVSEGDVIDIERLKVTDEITFTPLLVVGDDGVVISDRDALSKSKVVAEVLGEHRGDKIEVFKYKNKTGYRRSQGHRQTYTTIRVTSIEAPGKAKTSAKTSTKQASAQAEKSDAASKKAEKSDAASKKAEKAAADAAPAAEAPGDATEEE